MSLTVRAKSKWVSQKCNGKIQNELKTMYVVVVVVFLDSGELVFSKLWGGGVPATIGVLRALRPFQ